MVVGEGRGVAELAQEQRDLSAVIGGVAVLPGSSCGFGRSPMDGGQNEIDLPCTNATTHITETVTEPFVNRPRSPVRCQRCQRGTV
jgi:hypothetical protein